MANTLYEGYDFTDEDLSRFDTYGMNVQDAVDQGFTYEEITQAAKEIEQDEAFKAERAAQPIQQSRPVAPIPEEVPVDTGFFDSNTEGTDLAKTFGSTLSSMLGSTVGFGLEKWGESTGNTTLFETGKYLKDRANEISADLNASMSAGAKADSIGSRDLLKFDKPDDIIPSGLGNANLGTIMQLIAGGAASTLPVLGVGGKLASGLSKIPGVGPGVAGAVGYGAAGGAIEGMSTASDVHDDAMRVTDAEIVKSPIFQKITEIVQAQYPDAQGSQLIDFTRKQIANQAALEAGGGSAALIALTSLPIGSFLGRSLAGTGTKAYRKGMASTIYGGAWREGMQEFFQEGGQQIAQNYGKYLTGQNPDAISFEGVTEAGARGLAAGGPMGGVTSGYQNLQLDKEPVVDPPMPDQEVPADPADPNIPPAGADESIAEEEDLLDDIDDVEAAPVEEAAETTTPPPIIVPTDPDDPAPPAGGAAAVEIKKLVDQESEAKLATKVERDKLNEMDDSGASSAELEAQGEKVDIAQKKQDAITKKIQDSILARNENLREELADNDGVIPKASDTFNELKKFAEQSGIPKEEVDKIRLGDPKEYTDRETGSVLIGKTNALRKLIEDKIGVQPKAKTPPPVVVPVDTPLTEESVVDDDLAPDEYGDDMPEFEEEVIQPAPALETDTEEYEDGYPVARDPKPEEFTTLVGIDKNGEEEILYGSFDRESVQEQIELHRGEFEKLTIRSDAKEGQKYLDERKEMEDFDPATALVDIEEPVLNESLSTAVDLVDRYQDAKGVRDQKDLNAGQLRELAGSLGIKLKKGETKFGVAKKIIAHVKKNRPQTEIDKASKAGRVEIAKTKADTVDVDTKIATSLARAIDAELPVSLETVVELEKRILALGKKTEDGTITEQERVALTNHINARNEIQGRPTQEWRNSKELRKYLSRLKKEKKKKLEKLWDTRMPSTGLGELLSDPATRDTALEWLEVQLMSAKMSKGLTDTGDTSIQKILPDDVIMRAFENAYKTRDKTLTEINKRRNSKAAKLEEKLVIFKNTINAKVKAKEITKEEGAKRIAEEEGRLAKSMENAVKGYVKEATTAEEKFYALAKKYDFDPSGFKPQLIEDATIEDLEEATTEVADRKKDFTVAMNELYRPDGSYVGPTGGGISQTKQDDFDENEIDLVSDKELEELKDRARVKDEENKGSKAAGWERRDEDPANLSTFPDDTNIPIKRKAGTAKKTKLKVKYKPSLKTKPYKSPFKKTKGIGSVDNKGYVDAGLSIHEKGSIDESKGKLYPRSTQSPQTGGDGHPLKLAITEVGGVKNIEIIADDGTSDGAWIGAITLELLPTGVSPVSSTFNKPAMEQYGITLDAVDRITAHAVGATVFPHKENNTPGYFFGEHKRMKNMLTPEQRNHYDNIAFSEQELVETKAPEKAPAKKAKKVVKSKKAVADDLTTDIKLGDEFSEAPIVRDESGNPMSVEEQQNEAAIKEEKKTADKMNEEMEKWMKSEAANPEGKDPDDLAKDLALMEELMADDFNEEISQHNPNNSYEDVVNDDHEQVTNDELNCNIKLGDII
jgi:hypothetical protein